MDEEANLARAAELLAMGRSHPAGPRGWWEQLTLVQTLDARLQAELPPATYAAALARGQTMDVRQTAEALLPELVAR